MCDDRAGHREAGDHIRHMASRLRAPVGSKLVRPVSTGSGLKAPPTGLPASKPPATGGAGSARPYEVAMPQTRSAPQVVQRRPPPAQGRPVSQAIPPQVGPEGPNLELGDKVLCAGKQGTLAFLGATQFARGVWAGVVLDSADGKNNGSVNGVQYFVCEAKRGLFARPEKLMLVAKASEAQAKSQEQPPPSPTFSVGDHVLVEGGKQGVVAFCGQTQFARGVWVGVVLEVPEGKNNGVVAGVQYFDCEPNHGLFTRPQKLTRVRRGDANGFQREQQSLRVPPLQRSTQSTPVDREGLRALREKLKVGDQVLVGGVKEGILQYIGPTDFAKGVWVGVELHEPLGKNDGSVSGKRYFQCEPKYGLFAPLPKVEKLASAADEVPANKPQGHVRRLSGSSTSSLGSSKPPRDASSVSSFQGSTSAGLSQLLHEKEVVIAALQGSLGDMEGERDALRQQVTDLSRQLEDVQFQLEEQGVISGDQLETATKDSSEVVSELQRAEQQAREQTVALQAELSEKDHRLSEHLSTIQELRASLDQTGARSQRQVEELTEQLASRQEQLASLTSELESMQGVVADLHQQVSAGEEWSQLLVKEKEELVSQLSHTSGDSSQHLAILNQQLQEKERAVGRLQGQVTALKDEAAKARSELETGQDHFVQECERLKAHHHSEMSAAEQRLEQLTTEHQLAQEALEGERRQGRSLAQDRELWLSERSRLQADQDRILGERDRALEVCDRLRAESASASTEQNELASQRRELMAERDQLIAERQVLQTEHEKVLGEKEELLCSLQEVQAQRQEDLRQAQEASVQIDSTQSELTEAWGEVERIKLESAVMQEGWEHEKVALQEQLELARVNVRELEQNLEEVSTERDSTLQQAQEFSDRLDSSESERDQLQLALENSQNLSDELQFQLDEISKRHNLLEQETNEECASIRQQLEAAEVQLGERERQLAEARERVESLEEELVISERSHDTALMEEEKQLLEERVKELTLQLESKRESQPVTPRDHQQLPDEEVMSERLQEAQSQLLEQQVVQDSLRQIIEENEQQIDFLNSVIADLQRKLETAEALAGLHGPVDDSYTDDDLEQGLPPPRLFCDICDVFDQHDTDDCPLQAASDTPPLPIPHIRRVPGGSSDRPYCENCEVFGHRTEECEYDVTY